MYTCFSLVWLQKQIAQKSCFACHWLLYDCTTSRRQDFHTLAFSVLTSDTDSTCLPACLKEKSLSLPPSSLHQRHYPKLVLATHLRKKETNIFHYPSTQSITSFVSPFWCNIITRIPWKGNNNQMRQSFLGAVKSEAPAPQWRSLPRWSAVSLRSRAPLNSLPFIVQHFNVSLAVVVRQCSGVWVTASTRSLKQ